MKYIIIFLLTVSVSWAAGPRSNNGMGQGMGHGMMWPKNLDLSNEQLTQIQELRETIRKDRQDQRDLMKDEREKIATMLAGDASDDSLKKEFVKIQDAKAKRALERFEEMLKIRKILTPEQRQKSLEFFKSKFDERKDGQKKERGNKKERRMKNKDQ